MLCGRQARVKALGAGVGLTCVLTVSAAGSAGRAESFCAPPARIYLMNTDGSGQTNLTTNNFAADHSPAWSPDGTRIAFERAGAILVMNADGRAPRRVTSSIVLPDSEPAWSPDGTRIAFTSGVWPRRNIAVTQLATRVGESLTNDPADDIQPAWSPDGTRIAFVSSRAGSFDIFVMNAGGSGQTDLTQSPAVDDMAPAWSPDGTRIAFASGTSLGSEIFVMNADGSGPRNLTGNSRQDSEPAWSPDGTKIAFVRNSESNKGYYPYIFTMNADGSGQTVLKQRRGPYDGPAWSPDGRRIAFSYDRSAQIFGLGAPPCYVPPIVGLRLDTARVRIRRGFCLTGRIRYARSARPRGRVVAQYPRPRAARVPFSCVYPVVSRGRR
jgi:Tol biopolymer transport system component